MFDKIRSTSFQCFLLIGLFIGFVFSGTVINSLSVQAADDPLRIIVFGAHPDDCEIRTGGCAIMWENQGHKVKYVSTTNGDIGHSVIAGGPLAIRRTQEAEAAAKKLGISETQVLDNHDGELMPTLENRKDIIRLIRDWDADIVITNRPNDYHPDHRYTSILVQDSAYMVAVPFICPDEPPLKGNPVFLYWADRFQKPYPFQADIVVGIDDVLDQKYEALHELGSQFYEGGAMGAGDPSKYRTGDKETLMEWLVPRFERRFRVKESWIPILEEYYGKEKAAQIKHAEAFEICEYGRRPSKSEIKKLFPFFPDGE